MPSSVPAAVQVDSLAEASFIEVCCGVAVFSVLLYDTLLSLGKEIPHVWQLPRASASLLYIFNRYIPLLYSLFTLPTINPVSDESCIAFGWINSVLVVLGLLGPSLFTSLRIYALTGRDKRLLGVALALTSVPFFINVVRLSRYRFTKPPEPVGCFESSPDSKVVYLALTVASRLSLTLGDVLAVAVTWRKTYYSAKTVGDALHRPTLHQVMLQNGSVYFCTLASLNVLQIILTALAVSVPNSATGTGSYVVLFIDPLSSILNSRFLLALRATNARLGATGSTEQSSLAFTLYRPTLAGPELPEFLASLAGPVHNVFQGEDPEVTVEAELAPSPEEFELM